MSTALDEQIIKSPLKTLAEHDLDTLDYKPEEFPGARDVDTPFGSIRAYEWGPVNGPKVLMMHGLNTACHSLAKLANAAVHKGCRVMLFDLFGRGFSDTPSDLNHDNRLYITQILLVLASSDLAWTGLGARIKLVGYSLGGALAVHFAGVFPRLIESVFLVAPAGMIDPNYFSKMSQMVVDGPTPDVMVQWLVKRKLKKPLSTQGRNKGKNKGKDEGEGEDEDVPDKDEDESLLRTLLGEGGDDAGGLGLAEAEVIPAKMYGSENDQSLTARVARYQRWMADHYRGLTVAVTSISRHGPSCDQLKAYKNLAYHRVKTGFIFAKNDTMVYEPRYRKLVKPEFYGRDDLMWKVVGGGHHFVTTNASEVVGPMLEFWEMD